MRHREIEQNLETKTITKEYANRCWGKSGHFTIYVVDRFKATWNGYIVYGNPFAQRKLANAFTLLNPHEQVRVVFV